MNKNTNRFKIIDNLLNNIVSYNERGIKIKNIIKATLISLLGLTLITGCGCEKKETETPEENDTKVNTSEDVIKDQELGVFTFTNTSLTYANGASLLETVVTNTSNETAYLKEFKIHVFDKEGNEIETLTGFVGDNIEANSEKIISSSTGMDISNADSIKYEVIK